MENFQKFHSCLGEMMNPREHHTVKVMRKVKHETINLMKTNNKLRVQPLCRVDLTKSPLISPPAVKSFNESKFNPENQRFRSTAIESDSESDDHQANGHTSRMDSGEISHVCCMLALNDINSNDLTLACALVRNTNDNKFHRQRVILDTGASTNLFAAGWAANTGKAPALLDGLHETKVSGPAARSVIKTRHGKMFMSGYVSNDLPTDCVALIGRPTIRKLTKHHGLNMWIFMRHVT